jgi:hypothetical protein
VKYLTLAAAALPLCVILCSCAAEADTLPVGQWGAVKYGFGTIATACQASSDLDRFHELRASDEMASEVYATEHCVQLVGGTEVFVEKQWFGETCVRPRGTTDCLWIQAIAIWSKATADAFRAQHIEPGLGAPSSRLMTTQSGTGNTRAAKTGPTIKTSPTIASTTPCQSRRAWRRTTPRGNKVNGTDIRAARGNLGGFSSASHALPNRVFWEAIFRLSF